MFKRKGQHGKKKEFEEAPAVVPATEELELSSDSEVEASEEEEGFSEATDDEADLPSASDLSSGGEEEDGEDESDDEELDGALLEAMGPREGGEEEQSLEKPSNDIQNAETLQRLQGGGDAELATGGRDEEDAASDSSEDERVPRNTVGQVPLEWYGEEGHIGYTREGGRLVKRDKAELEGQVPEKDRWRTIYDEYNDEQITLSKEEIELIKRIRQGRFPHVEVNPFEPEADWFTRDVEIHPLQNAPEPKRRFMPSKWEEKKIVKLVRALRKGWIKREKDTVKEPDTYLMWADGGNVMASTATGLTYIPPTKPKLPGHEESYNPPQEYLPTEDEKSAHDAADDEDKPAFLPQSFDSLRKVPAYERFIKERFERCLDLYLCPRARKKRAYVKDPQTLVPKLPKPQDLQPFPTTLLLHFKGHKGPVRTVCPTLDGQWLASGSDDGSAKLWEVATGRCIKTWAFGAPVRCVAWCPTAGVSILAVAAGSSVFLLPSGLGTEESVAASTQALVPPPAGKASDKAPLCRWQASEVEQGGLELVHQYPVSHITWHGKGDYFASVAPAGINQAVLVHQLSKRATQNPFRKNKGRVVRVAFHPAKPFFFVATQNSVRIYNLAKQELAKKLISGSGGVTSLAIHSSGDHVIVGGEDNRLAWFDLDLSTKPYRALRYHQQALRGVAFHRSYPLFASASDDGTVHVFHGMVYQDLLTNPLIVPVKILRGHKIEDYLGVLDCAFHPTQPWIFSAGGDGLISLFTN